MQDTSRPARRAVRIPIARDELLADLSVPYRAAGLVLFAHGSGSGRRSPRNRFVAEALEHQGVATLLLDLLTEEEAAQDERAGTYRFRIPLLGERLVTAVDWAQSQPVLDSLGVGLYGASTGGAAALIAAAARPKRVQALVLRGARSDLAADAAERVEAPTLLLVGALDPPILDIARETVRRLAGPHSTIIVPGATHLFEEPGALEAVTENTTAWFCRYLRPVPRSPAVRSGR